MRFTTLSLAAPLLILSLTACQSGNNALREKEVAVSIERVDLISDPTSTGTVVGHLDKGEYAFLFKKSEKKQFAGIRRDHWYYVIKASKTGGWVHGSHLIKFELPPFMDRLRWGRGEDRIAALQSLTAADETTKKGLWLHLAMLLYSPEPLDDEKVRVAEALTVIGPAPQWLVKELMESFCTSKNAEHSFDGVWPEAAVFGKLGPPASPVVMETVKNDKRDVRYCAYEALKYMDPGTPGFASVLAENATAMKKREKDDSLGEIRSELQTIYSLPQYRAEL